MSVPTRFRGRRISPFRLAITIVLAATGPLLGLSTAPDLALALTQSVSIQGTSPGTFAYAPSTVAVNGGDPVLWTNNSTSSHTVTRCDNTNCPAVGAGTGTNPAAFDSGALTSGGVGTFKQAFNGAGTYNYYCTIHGYTVMHGIITVGPTPGVTLTMQSAVSTSQYTLVNSDGNTWQEIDASKLRVTASPTVNQFTVLSANVDLWTYQSGFNQDVGIFASDNGGGDTLVAWKESGGSAGTFSPNAAFVQGLYSMTANHSYVFKLKWKTSSADPGTISAAAGPISGAFSPTSLTSQTFPAGVTPNYAVSTTQYSLTSSDGTTWQDIDATNLATTLNPSSNGTAVLGGNADLWTWQSGQNQDIGIFVSDNGGTDTLVSWKESGGSAGTFSPNAAFVKGTLPVVSGHSYVFKLKWKTAQAVATGNKISAGAGPISGAFSPTSLFAYIPASGNLASSVSTSQYSLTGSDGTTWQPIDAATNVSVTAAANTNSLVGTNLDLWTWQSGHNQDISIWVQDNALADALVAWKESGGNAGTFSPNAALAQAPFPMTSGHTYVFKLKWKTSNADASTISAGAGPISGAFSPTRLTVESMN